MSELKVCTPKELVMQGKHNEPIYLKSEADKVIAELKDEASTAHRVCSRQIQQIASNEQEIRHQKYKRCLAMARWCNDRYILDDCLYELGKTRFYERWEKRWLEFAEKFKPNNSTAQ